MSAAALVLAAGALAAPAVDQQQPVIDEHSGLIVGGAYEQKLAQVVTSGVAGRLTEVRVPIECRDNGTVTLAIHNASTQPSSTVLTSSSFAGSSFPPGPPQFRSLPLATPPFISSETQFAIVLSATGNCGVFLGPRADVYPRGNLYFDSRPNPPGMWFCVCGVTDGRWDLAFQTLVEAACLAPDVVERTRREAEDAVRANGCAVGAVRGRFSASPPDTVISQSPAAGTQLATGSAVDLVVSRGERPCVTPRLTGKTLNRARAAIAGANCTLGRVGRKYSRRFRRGIVISQQPRPGARLAPRGRVSLVLSRGRR